MKKEKVVIILLTLPKAKELREKYKELRDAVERDKTNREWEFLYDNIQRTAQAGDTEVILRRIDGVYKVNWKKLKKLGYKVRWTQCYDNEVKISW